MYTTDKIGKAARLETKDYRSGRKNKQIGAQAKLSRKRFIVAVLSQNFTISLMIKLSPIIISRELGTT